MGKEEEDQPQGSGEAETPEAYSDGFCCSAVARLRCAVALVLGAAVLLSSVFWLPPFAGRHGGAAGLDPDGRWFGADIVASFRLQKTVAELNENVSKLEYDIYAEIGVPNSTVSISSLDQLDGSGWTSVIFSILPYPKNTTISSTSLSILRSYFMSLVVEQSTLHLTTSLFGNSSFFEVLKFPRGITIIPPQSAFLLQRPYASFNFTLNFPIYKVQDKVGELKAQMKLGLLLNSYENLYIKLTNVEGSTVAPPTIVQTSIVLEVGNHQPSLPRMKQLAQTIANSSSGNLGLNNTVFGRVKQISLSSYLRHSLNSSGSFSAPSPAPRSHLDHHHHHHHHRHHRRHHHSHQAGKHLTPAPSPKHTYQAPPPSGCPFEHSNKQKNNKAAVPVAAPHHSVSAPVASRRSDAPASAQHSTHNPNVHKNTPAPSSPMLPKSPLPAVSFARVHPPTSDSAPSLKPLTGVPLMSPEPHSSSASSAPVDGWGIVLVAHLLASLL